MESVGQLLRKEREAQEKSLDDVAKDTKMSASTLEALEDDRFSALPAQVYVKGHLRTYARYLGLNEDDVVGMYLRFTQQQAEGDELDEWDAVELELSERKETANRRWVLIGVTSIITIILLVVGIRWIGGRGSEPVTPETEQELEAVTDPVSEAAAPDTTIEWHKLELMAVARERTWIRVSVDGTPVSDLTLEPGERRLWEANERFLLDVGNGGGLELYLDGEFLGTAGTGSRLVEGLEVTEEGMSR
jgi:transcriptional regulator with XRE-family HTH domain